jgi:multiple sugar transport system permease protein
MNAAHASAPSPWVRLRRWLPVAGFLLPNFIGFILFTAGPVLASLGLSFTSWDLLTSPRWVGLENFVQLLGFHRDAGAWVANDPGFWHYLGNTLVLMLALPVNIATSLGLALLICGKSRINYAYRLLFYLPAILAGVAIFYLWRWIFNAEFGLLNVALATVGIEGPAWLNSQAWAKPALILMQAWLGLGGAGMILYIAALQGVPRELYEAASVDGASPWQRFWAVTWPGVFPVTFFLIVTGVIHGLQGATDAVLVMTEGGPFGATTTLGYYIYQKAYVHFEMGYAAAVAWVLFALVLVATLFNWKKAGRSHE